MATLSDKLILFLGGALLLYLHWQDNSFTHIFALLAAVTFFCLCSYCNLECQRLGQLPNASRWLLAAMCLSLAGLSLSLIHI